MDFYVSRLLAGGPRVFFPEHTNPTRIILLTVRAALALCKKCQVNNVTHGIRVEMRFGRALSTV